MGKIPKYGFSMIRIFRIWTESCPYFPVFKQILYFCPNTGKCEYDSVHIRENTVLRKPLSWHILRTNFVCRIFIMV